MYRKIITEKKAFKMSFNLSFTFISGIFSQIFAKLKKLSKIKGGFAKKQDFSSKLK